jgi:PHD/YefM family antitoxin component YafN of YafNO toxin-antitoxin module
MILPPRRKTLIATEARGSQAKRTFRGSSKTHCSQAVLANRNRTIYNAVNRAINGATYMNTISANDLKTKGVSAIEQALADQQEASVTVRGQMKYVVMSREQYAHLRECELEAALAESKADLDAGRFVKESVEQHIKRLAKLAA